jgi:uncharacterized protein (TIGR00297 family)
MYVTSIWLSILAWVATLALWILVYRGWFQEQGEGNEEPRKSWGMVYFSLTFAVLTSIPFWLTDIPENLKILLRWLNGFSFMILAFADGFAGWIGRWYGVHKQGIGLDKKTWLGFVVFWMVSVLVSVIYIQTTASFLPFGARTFSWLALLPQLIVFGFVLAATELISSHGSDNVFLVLASWIMGAALGFGLMGHPHMIFYFGYGYLFGYLVFSLVFSFVLWVIMAWLLAFVVVIMARWSLLPLLLFMGAATLIGKWRKHRGSDSTHGDRKEGKPRDRSQVLANGGVFLILAILHYCAEMGIAEFFSFGEIEVRKEQWVLLALISLSASSSDTMSSEIGQWLGGSPRMLLTLKKVSKGLSGGVTLAGFLGGLFGAFMIACCVFLVSDGGQFIAGFALWKAFGMVFVFGFMGTILDSLLGELVQAKYVGEDGELRDNQDSLKNEIPQFGWRWMNNDRVNILSNLAITLMAYFLYFK